MRTLIRNGRLISPGLEIPGGALLMEAGRILSVHRVGDEPAADEVLDAGGRRILPGFIDIHAHGADGADTCDGTLESIRWIARRKLVEGVTTWLPTTLTLPRDRLEAAAAACALYREGPTYCRVPGIHLEGPFLNPAMTGAQNPEFVRPPDASELLRLHEIVPVRLLSIAPELPGAERLVAVAAGAGIVVSAAHTAATYEEILRAKEAGLSQLTHFGNAMRPLHHREIGTVGAGILDDDLRVELICDGVHLSRDMLRLVFKVVPIGRILLITDSTSASWRPDGPASLGGLEVIVRDGIARLAEGGGLAGSTLRYPAGLALAASVSGLPLTELVKATSWNQASALGLDGLGKLEPGYHADLAILEEDGMVWKTFVGGSEPD